MANHTSKQYYIGVVCIQDRHGFYQSPRRIDLFIPPEEYFAAKEKYKQCDEKEEQDDAGKSTFYWGKIFGIMKNYDLAEKCWRIAIKYKHVEAMKKLGNMYYQL